MTDTKIWYRMGTHHHWHAISVCGSLPRWINRTWFYELCMSERRSTFYWYLDYLCISDDIIYRYYIILFNSSFLFWFHTNEILTLLWPPLKHSTIGRLPDRSEDKSNLYFPLVNKRDSVYQKQKVAKVDTLYIIG